MIAYHNELPEMNHNEIVGWKNNSELLNHFAIIWIKDQSDQERVKLRQKITSNILQNPEISQFSIEVSENQRIVRLFHLIHFSFIFILFSIHFLYFFYFLSRIC